MAITFDMSQPIRRPSERVALVEAVLAAHAADEAEWIEWKREVPLGTAAGNFVAARHILGFSNRKPVDAARFIGGQAYLLVGVEPGDLVGAPAVDPAVLEDWLRPYLGADGPVWDAHNVDVHGVHVLAIEIAAPKDGDPIRTLRKAYNEWHEGALFIRHKGKTERPSSSEVAMLSVRAAALAERVSVSVSWAAEAVISALDFAEPLERLIETRRAVLLRPLEAAKSGRETEVPADLPGDPAAGVAASVMRDVAKTAAKINQAMGYQPDDRSAEDYRNEVDSYIEKLRQAAPAVALGRAMASGVSRLVARVENPTESNFQRLRVRIHIAGPVRAVDAEEEDEWAEKHLPRAPRSWGSMRPPSRIDPMSFLARQSLSLPTVPRIRSSGLNIEHDGSATVTFDPVDLRPRDVFDLDAFHLFPRPELAGEALEATWEATSTSADGVASGVMPIRVREEVLAVEQLLDEASREGEDG